MAQIVETYCEDDSNEAVAATPDVITHVEVHKMTVHDGHRLADALDDLSERALTPAVMLGQIHISGSSDNMALTVREQNINLVAPARAPPKGAVSGRFDVARISLSTKKAWSCAVPITSNRFQRLARQSQAAGPFRPFHLPKMSRYTCDVPCRRPSVTANFPAFNIPRPGLPTKSAGFMNKAMPSATSTDGGPA